MYNTQHRRWLPRNHPFREVITTFDYCTEHGEAPRKMKGTNILVWAATRDTFVTNGGRPARANPARIYGIKRLSVLFDLP